MWFEHLTSHVLNHLFTNTGHQRPAGLLLGYAVEPPHRAVILPDRYRCEHAVIVGKTGTGKTYLLESLAWQLAQRKEGFVLFDFHGDVSLSLIRRLLDLPTAADRLIVVDPSHPTHSPGINVLEVSSETEAERFRKVSELSSVLRQRWGVDSFGARTEELLRNSLYLLAANHYTLADLPRLLTSATFRSTLVERVDHPDIRLYWQERYEPVSDRMKVVFREPLLNKVTAFLTEPAARHLLSQRESTVDVSEVMRQQQWLIIRLPKGRLREHAHTLGNLLFAQVQFAALAREALPVRERTPFTLLCDEVQNLSENDLNTLLTEGRKFGIAVITANQFWEQLARDLRGALLSAASHLSFRISAADAQILAAELSLERRSRLTIELTNLVRGEAVGRVGPTGLTHFRVPGLPTVSPVTSAELDHWVAPVSRLREDIERDLRERTQDQLTNSPVRDDVNEGHHGW
jgi:hypothetical protein